MRRFFPLSLFGLVATAIVFALQAIPGTGFYLMFAFAMLWSVILINASMIGVAIEAYFGQVSRLWLLLPLVFYGGYWTAAAMDHLTLRRIANMYDTSNARVVTGFDPVRQALVFNGEGYDVGAWFTQNFGLPVAYSVNPEFPDEYRSYRMIESAVCTKVRENRALQEASVRVFGVQYGDAIGETGLEKHYCNLSMPEKPALPIVVVERNETEDFENFLPVRRTNTTIAMPDGRRFELFGGWAAPLSWLPLPLMGCSLDSGAARWGCSAGFWRSRFTPIISGDSRYRRDSIVLAKALGLNRALVGGDSNYVLARIAEIEKGAADGPTAP